MKATDLISLLGGLSLFLYGMQMMSNGLEAAAGNKMKRILERLTANRILAYWWEPVSPPSFSPRRPPPSWLSAL